MESSDAAVVAPSSSINAASTTWETCVGPARWLNEPLQRILSYPSPLPVQQAVIPTITRALMSGVPNDVSLTAPTGSGKTLCYLIPLLRLLTETKKGVDDNALRCLILVPTQSLGQQVHRELQRLTRPTSIRVACICADVTPDVQAASAADAAEAAALVRRVALPRCAVKESANKTASLLHEASINGLPGTAKVEDEDENGSNASDTASEDGEGNSDGFHHDDDDEEDGGLVDMDATAFDGSSAPLRRPSGQRVRYFSNADVIVATPQRLLHHLDHTRGLRLVDLRLFVIDEADQVLVGNFAAQVQKVNARYEYEVAQQQRVQQRRQQRTSAVLEARMAADASSTTSSMTSSSLLRLHGGAHGGSGAATLHKVLCSATLSSRIARISQVKLRNCSYYVLDSNGEERKEEAAVVHTAASTGPGQQRQKRGGGGNAPTPAVTVRTQFALPPTLQEHVVFVEDAYRPAVLLKLVHALRERITAVQKQQSRAQAARQAAMEAHHRDKEATAVGGEAQLQSPSASVAVAAMDYPSVEDRAGTSVLIFCATAEEARVMSHFLAAAGVTSVVEFTTLASEAERRRALLQQRPSDSSSGGAADDVACVVASDALMRGIDIPNVGHVIMYHPPDAVSQYVHRAGRTARAMRPGHVHLLLSKTGPSGTQEDGEMALYKRLSQSLSRTLPVSYERQFFRFAENPARLATPAADATAAATSASAPAISSGAKAAAAVAAAPSVGSAEWWVAQSEQFLAQSQHQLQRRWASVLESAAAVAAASAKKTAATVAVVAPGTGSANGEAKKSAVASLPSSTSSASGLAAASASRKRTRAAGAK